MTWQQFFVATLLLTLVWYAGVILIYYRKELKAFLKGSKTSKPVSEALPHRWDEDTLTEESEDNLMGKPALPDGMSIGTLDQISFAENQKESQLGEVPDLLDELKNVFSILEKEDGNKSDFFSLMKLVTAKYPKIKANPNFERINAYIRKHASFLLSDEELDNLWD